MQTLYGQGFAVQILVLGISMPTCEELVYRGLVYKRLRYTSPFLGVTLYSSLVFAFTHGNLVQGLYGFIMGMMFCYVYEKYGSVKAPILAHITAEISCQWLERSSNGSTGCSKIRCVSEFQQCYVHLLHQVFML